MSSVWIVTRETGIGRHRTVIGVYREEWEARDRVAAEEAKDEAVQWDYDVEEFDVLGGEVKEIYLVLEEAADFDGHLFIALEDGLGREIPVLSTDSGGPHPFDPSLVRIGPIGSVV